MLDRNVTDFRNLPYQIEKNQPLVISRVGADTPTRSYITIGQDIYLTGNILAPG